MGAERAGYCVEYIHMGPGRDYIIKGQVVIGLFLVCVVHVLVLPIRAMGMSCTLMAVQRPIVKYLIVISSARPLVDMVMTNEGRREG